MRRRGSGECPASAWMSPPRSTARRRGAWMGRSCLASTRPIWTWWSRTTILRSTCARAELERCYFELGLKGLKLGPIYQNYDPTDERAFSVYDFAERHHIPIMIHQATTFPSTGHLKYALPLLLDEVAIRFPELVMV